MRQVSGSTMEHMALPMAASYTPAQVQRKLEQGLKSLKVLNETMDRSQRATDSIVGILNSFEQRLNQLEKAILPIYRQTDIEKTLMELNGVVKHYSVANDVEQLVKQGVMSGPSLNGYLEALDRLWSAWNYFTVNNPDSAELENVKLLFNLGMDSINKHFRELLTSISKPLIPVTVLDALSNENEVGAILKAMNLESDSVKELKQLAAWMADHNRDMFLTVYAKVRASLVVKTLNALKDHQRKGSLGIDSRSPTVPTTASPAPPRRLRADAGTRHLVLNRIQALAEKKMGKTLEVTGKHGLGKPRGSSADLGAEDKISESDIEVYLICLSAFMSLLEAEKKVAIKILPSSPLSSLMQTFEVIIRDAVEHMTTDGQGLLSRLKKAVPRQDFNSIFAVVPVLQHLLTLQRRFDSLTSECSEDSQRKFKHLMGMFFETESQCLEDFIEALKLDQDKQVPSDGTVHQLTSNIMMSLEPLRDTDDTLGHILQVAILSVSFLDKPLYQKAVGSLPLNISRKKALLGVYLTRVVAGLSMALNNKSESYSDTSLKAVFRLNNTQYILTSLQRSGLLDIMRCYQADCEDHLLDQIVEQKRIYSQGWSKVLHYITGADIPQASFTTEKMRERDRQMLKDKFLGFNREVEEIGRIQRHYSIPDPELRESLKRDNKEFILPAYQTFFDRYARLPFTKNPAKYVKYSPVDISQLIDNFFDIAA
ncbi:unnamed protein product [Darwinula stevensoni]|uniref:Exocyst complex component 7 n=1 Tax=Darwinula stevensoni TaxID=69355 RepID=A0A7R8WZ84_9CRUS|nr:unnamed protein product [Darwinula stevensoni]CAG0879845.1 unnamed protein product [Darwinula stevensoni]